MQKNDQFAAVFAGEPGSSGSPFGPPPVPEENLCRLVEQSFWATVTSNGSPICYGTIVLSVCNAGDLCIVAKRLVDQDAT